jgi:hypothetical protein
MGDSAFTHTPLTDPANGIRLLRFLDHAADGSLTFDLGNYVLSNSLQNAEIHPPYAGISYTWGSAEKTHRICVNGDRLAIGANSHYALNQAVVAEQNPTSPQYYWMDQICIDQENLEENGLQVGNMAEIFRQAELVNACVGPHADGSEQLFDTIWEFELEGEDYTRDQAKNTPRFIRWPMTTALAKLDKGLSKWKFAMELYVNFKKRHCWERLWIVQELWLSRDTIILCGLASCSYRMFEHFRRELSHVYMQYEGLAQMRGGESTSTGLERPPTLELLELRTASKGEVTLLSAMLALCQGLHCSDRRDAVYAIRALIDWPSRLGAVQVDYTITPTELFWRTLSHVREDNGIIYHYGGNGAWEDIFWGEMTMKPVEKDSLLYTRLWKALHGTDMDESSRVELLEQFPNWKTGPDSKIMPHDETSVLLKRL